MNALCVDCGVDTTPCTHRRGCRHTGKWEYYMLRDDVWAAAVMDRGFLCVGCLEHRIGRRLRPSDFRRDLAVNLPNPWDTARLAARKAWA